MRFQRGQAFETMMLVISVIVALAILAVLMNIIQNINPGQQDVALSMHDQLKSIVTSGYGCSAPVKTVLRRGTTLFAQQVKGDIVSITGTDLFTFDPDTSQLAGVTPSGTTVADAKLSTASLSSPQAQIVFTVCGNTAGSPQKFKVCLAATDASTKVSGCSPA